MERFSPSGDEALQITPWDCRTAFFIMKDIRGSFLRQNNTLLVVQPFMWLMKHLHLHRGLTAALGYKSPATNRVFFCRKKLPLMSFSIQDTIRQDCLPLQNKMVDY